MKYLPFSLSLVAGLALIWVLSTRWGNIPPMGPFMDPDGGFWAQAERQAFSNLMDQLPGLMDSVEVHFDERRVPHVFAKNDHDLYYMQGYLQARDRLFQMELQNQGSLAGAHPKLREQAEFRHRRSAYECVPVSSPNLLSQSYFAQRCCSLKLLRQALVPFQTHVVHVLAVRLCLIARVHEQSGCVVPRISGDCARPSLNLLALGGLGRTECWKATSPASR